ncbi:MAG: LuxR C-terminal-related transcriptional regulator [Patescibacteria group bacterium]|jgi:hypothetical protein|nr:LuxR C-terminal-related transcriptional regulator [Patescibacteria group bacterium]
MSPCNPYFFWETTLRKPELWHVFPEEKGLWYESTKDQQIAKARQEFFEIAWEIIYQIMVDELTKKQWDVLRLFLMGKKQQDIAAILGIAQSSVSRCLYGTRRRDKRIGGIIQKIQKTLQLEGCPRELWIALKRYELVRARALTE